MVDFINVVGGQVVCEIFVGQLVVGQQMLLKNLFVVDILVKYQDEINKLVVDVVVGIGKFYQLVVDFYQFGIDLVVKFFGVYVVVGVLV